MGVACFYSSAPAPVHGFLIVIFITIFFSFFRLTVDVYKGTSVNQLVTVVTGENAWRSLGRVWELDIQVIGMCIMERET